MNIAENSISVKIKKAQRNDLELKAIIEVLQHTAYDDYLLRNDILYKYKNGQELLVPPKSMYNEVIQMAHNRGHFSVKRTEENLKNDYYIPHLKEKIEKVISNCIHCILANKKEGKQEGFLNPLEKVDLPLYIYHVDHLGPLESTHKNYNHIFAVIDSFTKFIWLYPVKSTTTKEVLSKLELQKQIFGNPVTIISDRGTAFSSLEFANYCKQEKIQHTMITTGLPRANGQIERINRTIIPVLTKLSLDDPTKWYKHVPLLQQTLNSTYQRSIDTTPFELLIGTKMRHKNVNITELLEKEFQGQFEEKRDNIRTKAKEQILKTQEENRRTYNLRRKKAVKYKVDDIVAIKRVQLGPGRKLRAKYLGPYKISKIKPNDTYDVKRLNTGEGPASTSTCAEYLKPWFSLNTVIEGDD